MPIHDWTRVRAGLFHHFRLSWNTTLCSALNHGMLPPDYYAIVARPGPLGTLDRSEASTYARRADNIVICRTDETRVGLIRTVCPGHKVDPGALRQFARSVARLVRRGIHVIVVDLFPMPNAAASDLHHMIWSQLDGAENQHPPYMPLTLASYEAGSSPAAYVENVAVGDVLPEMPLFIEPGRYVACPLEASYRTTWEDFPAPLKGKLEAPA